MWTGYSFHTSFSLFRFTFISLLMVCFATSHSVPPTCLQCCQYGCHTVQRLTIQLLLVAGPAGTGGVPGSNSGGDGAQQQACSLSVELMHGIRPVAHFLLTPLFTLFRFYSVTQGGLYVEPMKQLLAPEHWSADF